MPGKRQVTCFVVIGFGPKTDYETGRILDLDKTFYNLIKPVFDALQIECFRAKDKRHSGVIDVPMYEWIYKADIVVADVSTLNPNALYELGVRHALKPHTTIVISENKTRYPFDINHTIITPYEHMGKEIEANEVKRFKKELKALVQTVINNKKTDSPVYTYLQKLTPPKIQTTTKPKYREKEAQTKQYNAAKPPTLSELIEDAENAKNKKEFGIAIELYKVCLKFEQNNTFLIQRHALVTYKNEKPNKIESLITAYKILTKLNPEKTLDIETLGLSGSIFKRLFNETKKKEYLEKAIFFYSKAYYIARDYYNGINYAFLLTLKSTLIKEKYNAISTFIESQKIREELVLTCEKIINGKDFENRGDKQWIYSTLAEAYLALGRKSDYKIIIGTLKTEITLFAEQSFKEQTKELKELISKIKKKYDFSYNKKKY